MTLKIVIATATVLLGNTTMAQSSTEIMNLFNNQDSSESITFIEVPSEKDFGDVSVESTTDVIDKWDKPIEKEVIEEKEIEVVPLDIVKTYCKNNAHLFEEDKNNYASSENALKYIKNESLSKYCNRYVNLIKESLRDEGYIVGNLYAKPVKQGEVVDDLWIAQGAGQNEGVLGYIKNEDVKVLTVRQAPIFQTIQTTDLSPLVPINETNKKEQEINNKDSLSSGEVLVEEKSPVDKQIVKGSSDRDLLNIIVVDNNLIGKKLITDENQNGDLNMSQLIDLLPAHMKSFHIRVIGEGMPVTLDFRDTRINIAIDKQRIIKMINVG